MDPFKQQLVDQLESAIGHRLLEPDAINDTDLRAIVDAIEDAQEEAEWAQRRVLIDAMKRTD